MDWGNIKQSEQIKCAIHLTSQCGWITWRAQLKTVWPLVESTSFNAWKISLQNRKAKWPQNSFVFIPDLVFKRYVQLFKWKCPLFFAKLPEREWLKNDNKKFSVWFVERTKPVCRPCRATTRCLNYNKQKKNFSQNDFASAFAFVTQMLTCCKYPWQTFYCQIMTN